MMELWLMIVAAGLVTFVLRFSFIAFMERMTIPLGFKQALRFVPVAVLSAIIVPELLTSSGALYLSPYNARLMAGVLSALIAWRTRNVFVTIGVGMAVLFILQWGFGLG